MIVLILFLLFYCCRSWLAGIGRVVVIEQKKKPAC